MMLGFNPAQIAAAVEQIKGVLNQIVANQQEIIRRLDRLEKQSKGK